MEGKRIRKKKVDKTPYDKHNQWQRRRVQWQKCGNNNKRRRKKIKKRHRESKRNDKKIKINKK